MLIGSKKTIKLDVCLAYIQGWGPRRWRGTDSLRSLDPAEGGTRESE